MALFDFSTTNIENHYPPSSGFSWSSLISVIAGFILAKFTYVFKVWWDGRRFKRELKSSENSFRNQIKSIRKFKEFISNNRTPALGDELEINLKRKFNTIKGMDKMVLLDYYWVGNLFSKKKNKRPDDYVTNTMGTVENVVAEMERLEKYVEVFNTELISSLKTYTEELEAIKLEHDKHHNNMTLEQWRADPVLYFFGTLYVKYFHLGDKTMKPISMELFADAFPNFHSKISTELPFVADHSFRLQVMDYNHRARMIINFFNHTRQQTIQNIEGVERSLLMHYKEIFVKDLVV